MMLIANLLLEPERRDWIDEILEDIQLAGGVDIVSRVSTIGYAKIVLDGPKDFDVRTLVRLGLIHISFEAPIQLWFEHQKHGDLVIRWK